MQLQRRIGHQTAHRHLHASSALHCNTHTGLQRSNPCSRISCRVSSTAAANKPRLQPAATPRWSGFHTEAFGVDVFKHEVVALAAYDLDSGDAYTALINPALHDPGCVFGAGRTHGEEPMPISGKTVLVSVSQTAAAVASSDPATMPGWEQRSAEQALRLQTCLHTVTAALQTAIRAEPH
jgi:hypothetical protein